MKKMCSSPLFKLRNGVEIPSVGLGTWMATDIALEDALNIALETGYRHIDTAQVYQNERAIGKVLREWFSSGKISRKDMFVTSKLSPKGMKSGNVAKYLKESLESLQLDYIDLYLLHTPFGFTEVEGQLCRLNSDGTVDLDVSTDHVEIWKAMENQYNMGLTKAIGVSNFNERQIQKILDNCLIPPQNLQIEHHIYLQQPELIEFCEKNDILVTAYSPLGSPGLAALGLDVPDILTNPTVVSISRKYNKTPAQVLLRHIHHKHIVVIPKSTNPGRIRENLEIFDFQLTSEDLREMDNLDRGLRLIDFQFMFKGIKNHPEYPF